ncbi:MAG: beta-lactamase family protein [Altererythrobacter sp.]|nr:beta-lactamase family protein [Altererythrobacter sp.]
METLLVDEELVGIAWFLIDGDNPPNTGVAGNSDNELAEEFTLTTRFHVGSITKALLATGVLRLATSGELDLDAPIERYLPDLAVDNRWQNESPVTVRHLLDHTAGLDDARLWQIFSENAHPNTPLMDAFPVHADGLPIRSEPGRQFSYSNTGYALLGLIIEAVTGERYETYLNTNLLAPLSLEKSTFSFTTQSGDNRDPTLAWGHLDDGSRYEAAAVFLRPAGQFTTTVNDMATFALFLTSDGRIDGEVFIDESLMNARGHPTGTRASDAGLVSGYALGLGRRDRHGVVSYCHGGNIVGFSAMLCVFPEERKAYFYSVNTDSETADYGRIQSLLIDSLSVESTTEPPTRDMASDIAEWHGFYVFGPNRFAMFEYLDTVFGHVRITEESGSLAMSSLQQEARMLRPLGGYIFSANDRTTQSHVFHRDEDDAYLLSDGFQTFRKVPAIYLFAHWASVLLGLGGLIWFVVAGLISLIQSPRTFLQNPITPAFAAIILLPLPVPFFMTQSFMALGDLTIASGLLAVVTALLPIGMALTFFRTLRRKERGVLASAHPIMALFVIQWCVVLAAGGLLPLQLWV